VHPGCPGPFKGELKEVELIASALDVKQIAQRAPSATPRRDLWIENGRLVEETEQPVALTLDSGWEVSFQPKRGAPSSVRLDRLMDLSRHKDEGIRHFSGTMAYRTTFGGPRSVVAASSNGRDGARPSNRVYLDLGAVHNLAEVILNGRNLGILWKQPFRVDVTDAIKEGSNELEIRVTNLWVNRLIGDAKKMTALGVSYVGRGVIKEWPLWVPKDAPPADAPVSFATWRQWDGTEPLQPSGLVGPVTIRPVKTVNR